jgi:hypothetical protein
VLDTCAVATPRLIDHSSRASWQERIPHLELTPQHKDRLANAGMPATQASGASFLLDSRLTLNWGQ